MKSLVGIATALALQPNLPNDWKENRETIVKLPIPHWKSKTLVGLATMAMVRYQLNRLAKRKAPTVKIFPIFRLLADQLRLARLTKRYRKWMEKSSHR
ncbi:hypothetical protein [Leptospira kemamanensis]|uniref:hypothetical protein n=1 Tax=Leptospira kemamanensis TaxID=2484942 RepID=UPI001FC9FAD7|nr:hypothetical protein [Leptospira kemamanensis]